MSATVNGGVVHVLGKGAVVVKSPYGRVEHGISEEQGIKSLNTCTPNPITDPTFAGQDRPAGAFAASTGSGAPATNF